MVRKPGGKVLLNRTLGRGETARFGQQALVVTVGAPKSVRIRVNGEPRKPARRGIDTFKVSRQD